MERIPYDRTTRFDVSEPAYALFRKYREDNYGGPLSDEMFKLGHGQFANRPHFTDTAQHWDNFMAGWLAAIQAAPSTEGVEITEEMVALARDALAKEAWRKAHSYDAAISSNLFPDGEAEYVMWRGHLYEASARTALTAALSTTSEEGRG